MIRALFLGIIITLVVVEAIDLYNNREILALFSLIIGCLITTLAFAVSPWQFSF